MLSSAFSLSGVNDVEFICQCLTEFQLDYELLRANVIRMYSDHWTRAYLIWHRQHVCPKFKFMLRGINLAISDKAGCISGLLIEWEII